LTFLEPLLLLGLLLVPVLLGLYVWAQRRRTRYAVRFTNLDLLANLAPRRPAWRRHVPPVIYLIAVAALVVGLARPSMVIAVPREDATVILAIDVSGSMQATDVAPTRLDAAREAASDFVAHLPDGIRVGIVTFASRAVTLVAPTSDREAVATALEGLEALDGTAMGDGLMELLDLAEAIQDEAAPETDPDGDDPATSDVPAASADPAAPDASADPDGTTVETDTAPLVAGILLSDGANSVGDAQPLDAAERAAALDVPLYTIALGTADGRVTVRDPAGQAMILDVPPDTETLAQIAEITGGTAFDAPSAADLSSVYDSLSSRIGTVEEEQEVTAWFAAAALALIVVAAGASVLWFGRLP
jgi:Ca-activated chloride channel family protein